MAITARPISCNIADRGASNPIRVEATYFVSTDNPEAIALGHADRPVILVLEGPRGAVATKLNELLALCQIVEKGGWPEGAIALPLTVKP